MKIMANPITEPIEVEINRYQIKMMIIQHVIDVSGVNFDDAGCDWYTDNSGSVYIANNPEWIFCHKKPNLATMVDAANIIAYGHPLKLGIDN